MQKSKTKTQEENNAEVNSEKIKRKNENNWESNQYKKDTNQSYGLR